MSVQRPLSDQLYTWSAPRAGQVHHRPSTTTQNAPASTPTLTCSITRLAYRALQTLWQAGLQMRQRPRPRSQVLSVGEPHGCPTRDGLRAPGLCGAGHSVLGQLSPHPRDPRRALRHQSRALASPGGLVSHGGGRPHPVAHRHPRCPRRRRARGQHARRLARRQYTLFGLREEKR